MKNIIIIGTILLIIISVMVCSCCCSTGQQQFYELTYASMDNPEESMLKVINTSWARWLEKESKGRLKINFLPSEQAASAEDIYNAVELGIVDMGDQYLGMLPGRFPLNEVTQLPLIFGYPAALQSSLTHMALFSKYTMMQNEFSDVKVLLFHFTNPVQIHNTKKQVETLEDIKGLRIIALSKFDTAALRLLGAIPEQDVSTETNFALREGLVDGIGCNYTAMTAFNFRQELRYSTITNISNPGRVEIMNLNTWNSLPSDIQELFLAENAKLKVELYSHQYDVEDQLNKDMFNAELKSRGLPGIFNLADIEKERWIQVIQPIQQEWVNNMEVKGLPGEAILADCKKFASEYIYSGFDQRSEDILHGWGAFGH